MSAPNQNSGADAAARQALPADASVASGGAPDADARVGAVPPPPGGEGTASAPDGPTGQPQIDSLIASLPIDPELLERKPEILVGGAFAGAFLVAKIIRRIGS